MAAIQPSERPYLLNRVLDLYRHRVVWLLLLMISASFTGAIITYFEDALAAQVALTAFIPMLMDTGGNCGSQSSVTVIRSLSLGELRFGDWWRASWKELQVGVLCGVTLALANLARLTIFSQVGTAVALQAAGLPAAHRRQPAGAGPRRHGQPPDHHHRRRRLPAGLLPHRGPAAGHLGHV